MVPSSCTKSVSRFLRLLDSQQDKRRQQTKFASSFFFEGGGHDRHHDAPEPSQVEAETTIEQGKQADSVG